MTSPRPPSGGATDMATIATPAADRPESMRSIFAHVATLARRRSQLTVRTPRELFVPLLTPILFALVITPALALMRYGLLGEVGGLRDIWGMTSAPMMAWLSLLVVTTFAAVLTAVSVRIS